MTSKLFALLLVPTSSVLSWTIFSRPLAVKKTQKRVDILSKTSLNGQIPSNDILSGGTFSAHGKTCPKTGDHIHVSYTSSITKPFARVDIFEDRWKLKKTVDVNDLSCPVMIHDCAINENYAVVLVFL